MLAIILVESPTNKNSTDKNYMRQILDRFYKVGNSVKFKYIPMKGKSNFDKKEMAIYREIKAYKEFGYNSKEPINVFICVDTDDVFYDENKEYNNKLNKDIERYCKTNKYNFVWFSRDIEEVCINERYTKSSDKIRAVENFARKNKVLEIDPEKLEAKSNKYKMGYSNILTVFDKYFERKK